MDGSSTPDPYAQGQHRHGHRRPRAPTFWTSTCTAATATQRSARPVRRGWYPHRSESSAPLAVALTCTFLALPSTAIALPAEALDFRAAGGCVVAPPSWSAEHQRCYEVLSERPEGIAADLGSIRELLQPMRPRPLVRRLAGRDDLGWLPGVVGWLEARPEGNRNYPLFWAAKFITADGLMDSDARTAHSCVHAFGPARRRTRRPGADRGIGQRWPTTRSTSASRDGMSKVALAVEHQPKHRPVQSQARPWQTAPVRACAATAMSR